MPGKPARYAANLLATQQTCSLPSDASYSATHSFCAATLLSDVKDVRRSVYEEVLGFPVANRSKSLLT